MTSAQNLECDATQQLSTMVHQGNKKSAKSKAAMEEHVSATQLWGCASE